MRYLFIVAFSLVTMTLSAQDDRAQILDVIDNFFISVVEKGDQSALETISIPEARSYSTRITDGKQEIRSRLTKAHQKDDEWREALREDGLEIMIRKNIAMAWVPYDFWINGEHHHCGIDIFNFFKVDGQWKIASTTYTVEKEGCDEVLMYSR